MQERLRLLENNGKINKEKSMPTAKWSNFCAVTVCELK
jgi:hypothetical protein